MVVEWVSEGGTEGGGVMTKMNFVVFICMCFRVGLC